MSVMACVTYEQRVEKPRAASSVGVGRRAKRETALVSYNDLDATLTGRIIHTLTVLTVLNMILRCKIIFRGKLNVHLQDAMSGAMPKKPVSSRAKKRNNNQPSVADFCRLCKCSFRTVYWEFSLEKHVQRTIQRPTAKGIVHQYGKYF